MREPSPPPDGCKCMKPLVRSLILSSLFLALSVITGCSGQSSSRLDNQELPDTLRVATLYGPHSYFIYRDEPMGFDYDLVKEFAEDHHIALNLTVVRSLNEALQMLDDGKVDLLACQVPVIAEYAARALPCGPEDETYQVLIQPKTGGAPAITDVTGLPGHEVMVLKGSKYDYRLQNLNDELGGGIEVTALSSDTIITDDLISMVADGRIPLTIVDNDIAALDASYNPTVDSSVEISFHQTSAWAVAPDEKWLADTIDNWYNRDVTRDNSAQLNKRYYEMALAPEAVTPLDLTDGIISRYDDTFRKYAGQIGWDWRLLASQAYQESKFNPNARSWAGARGLMQIMPKTAAAYGLAASKMNNPEMSVATSVKLLRDLDKMLLPKVPDDYERLKFILAAYNGGIGHVTDAMALADKYGLDSTKWDNNVERAIMMKSSPQYYNDPVVRYGYMRGRETTDYVKRILTYYDSFKRQIQA